MRGIRFFEKGKPAIHRYIELPEAEIADVWKFMKDGQGEEHCFYECEGVVEYPRLGKEYNELHVEEAELFEIVERGWETDWRRERKKSVPIVGEIIERYPPPQSSKVIFTT